MSKAAEHIEVETLIDALADMAPVKARALADRLEADHIEVRDTLLRLEKHGYVYRTGRTRGTRWWLG